VEDYSVREPFGDTLSEQVVETMVELHRLHDAMTGTSESMGDLAPSDVQRAMHDRTSEFWQELDLRQFMVNPERTKEVAESRMLSAIAAQVNHFLSGLGKIKNDFDSPTATAEINDYQQRARELATRTDWMRQVVQLEDEAARSVREVDAARRDLAERTAQFQQAQRELTEAADQTQRDMAAVAEQATALAAEERQKLEEIRAERGQAELASYFKGLKRGQLMASWFFRVLAAALAGCAAVIALVLIGNADTWQEAAAHIAFTAVVTGIAAYSARLGAQHRATADWAATISIQLEAFSGFVGTLGDSDSPKTRVHEEFARRVLGPPPSSAESEASPIASSQILDIALEALKRSGRG
jgi:hypothetical protein